jgi:hypothetical protein
VTRIVNQTLVGRTRHLTRAQQAEARRRISRAAHANPLRRVTPGCCGVAARDPLARVSDRIWCDRCGDWATVVALIE